MAYLVGVGGSEGVRGQTSQMLMASQDFGVWGKHFPYLDRLGGKIGGRWVKNGKEVSKLDKYIMAK